MIMHLVQDLAIGGVQIMVVSLAIHLKRAGFSVAVCVLDDDGSLGEDLRAAGVGVMELKRSPGFDFLYPLRLARLLKEMHVSVLHLHNPTALFYGSLAGRLAGVERIIYTEHGRDYSFGCLEYLAERVASWYLYRIVVLHEYARDFLVGKVGMSQKKIVKIYNGVDEERFHGNISNMDFRGSLDIPNGQIVIGIVARLTEIKNHVLLFHALAAAKQQVPCLFLLVVGDGPLRWGLESLRNSLGLNDSIRFLGERQDVPALLKVMDFVVLPSKSEGLPITLIEACAAGVPIIASNVGGNAEVVVDGEGGVLFPANDLDALTHAVMEMAADPVARKHIGDAARQRFDQLFTLGKMTESYERLYFDA